MMPLTLSLPLVLADADGDMAVVAGMASAILTLISIGAYPLWSGSLAVLTCWSSTAD